MTGTEERLGVLLRAAAPVAEPIELEDVEAAVGRRARARAMAVTIGTVAVVAVGAVALTSLGPWRGAPAPGPAHGTTIPWVDATPEPYVAPDAPRRTTDARPCTVGDLHVDRVRHDGAAGGHRMTSVTLTNVSDSTCLLSGDPDVVAVLDGRPDVRAAPGTYYQGPGPADMARGESSVLTLETTTQCESYARDERPLMRLTLSGRTLDIDDPDGTDVGCGLAVAPFDGPVPPTPGVPDPMANLEVSIDAPGTLSPGRDLVYEVTLTNPTHHEIALDRCPAYVESLEGPRTFTASYVLACPDAIGPLASVRFQMRFAVPEDASRWLALSSQRPPTFPVTLRWALVAPFDVSADVARSLVPATAATARSTVTGTLLRVGGASGSTDEPLAGSVTFTDRVTGAAYTTAAGDHGAFRIALPPGSYDATGTSPTMNDGQDTCRANGPVLVTTGIAGVPVTCQVP